MEFRITRKRYLLTYSQLNYLTRTIRHTLLVAALLLFVGIPLPGTGAWTGTLAASILDMKFKDVLIACMGGVLLAGIIMGLASAGLLGALSGLFAV